ncbi:MAG: LysR family transcriptional regulator [Sulfuricella sp.]|nr:LysR family transcriptional regulator [Sulfuricella sp.]
MTLTDLRYIVALARERHFGRAAEKCFVAQPTLSVAVKKLEDELGLAIFERSAGEIRVTPVGAQIVAQAERVLGESARIKEIAQQGKDPLAGPLRLGVIYTIGPYLLPRLVPLLRERAPAMPLVIQENYTERLVEALKRGELDLIIIALPHSESNLAAQAVYDEAFRALVPAGHSWTREKAIDPARLLDEPLLMLGAGNCFRDQVLDLCAHAADAAPGRAPQLLEGGSLETIRYMVAGGIGITVMPASAVDNLPPDDPLLRALPFTPPDPTRRVGLVWRTSFPRLKVIDVVRQAMLDCKLAGTAMVQTTARTL